MGARLAASVAGPTHSQGRRRWLQSVRFCGSPKENVMSKGRDRPGKEKKKPKSDKNKKQKHQPFGGKAPLNQPVSINTGGKK